MINHVALFIVCILSTQSMIHGWKMAMQQPLTSSSREVILRMISQQQLPRVPSPKSITGQIKSLFRDADYRRQYESCEPQLDVELTNLLQGMASSTVEDIGSGVRAIRLGNNATFLDDCSSFARDTIYERDFYPHLANTIRGLRDNLILVGNPGTGKSVFQYYLLARYLNPSIFKDDAMPPPERIKFGPKTSEAPKVVIRHLPNVRMEVWFLEQQVVHVIEEPNICFSLLTFFDTETTVYFFEPGKTSDIEPFGHDNMQRVPTLATVPPEKTRYKQTLKSGSRLFMPVFTENELLAIGKDMRTRPDFDNELEDLYTDEKIRSRFATFNGMLRHVLPQSKTLLKKFLREQALALDEIDPRSFLTNAIEHNSEIHYLCYYAVCRDKDGLYDFTSREMAPVNNKVASFYQNKIRTIPLDDRIIDMKHLKTYFGEKYSAVPSRFESVIADHLVSSNGIKWKQRSVKFDKDAMDATSNTDVVETSMMPASQPPTPSPKLPTSDLVVKLTRLEDSEVPVFSDMKPMVLYRALDLRFPFCDLVYKDVSGSGSAERLVCIQVSLEADGKSTVKLDAFQEFCKRMDWGGNCLTQEQLSLIHYVTCPIPAVADQAAVSFEDGIGINEYTVWHVNPKFASGTCSS